MSGGVQCDQGPQLVIIRCMCSMVQACKNALIKHLSVHRNYGGSVAGYADQIQVLEGSWPGDRAVSMLAFNTRPEAQRWMDSVPELRQSDWLGGVDLVMVPIKDMPSEDKMYVQLMDLEIFDGPEFIRNYQEPAEQCIRESGATAGVVAATPNDVHKIRGMWNPSFVVVNFWKCPQQFEAAYNSDTYQPLKVQRQRYSNANMCFFELKSLINRRK